MAFQARQQPHFSRQVRTTNGQYVNDQPAAPRPNHPVQMIGANPFAAAMEIPWLRMNHMVLGTGDRVIQHKFTPTVPTHDGPTNMPPNSQGKRPRDSTTDQALNNFNAKYPLPSYAPENIKNEMKALRETEWMLCQESKKVRMQFAEKQNEAVHHLVESLRSPILKIFKEKDENMVNVGKLNTALQQNIKNLIEENKSWKDYAISCENKAMAMLSNLDIALAEISRLQGLVPPTAVVALPEEQEVQSFRGSNISGYKNTTRNAQASLIGKVDDACETEAKKVQPIATDKGEGSGEKKMCKSCGKTEMSVLALPCKHLCFCIVCGARESGLYGPCPVCASTMTATAPVTGI